MLVQTFKTIGKEANSPDPFIFYCVTKMSYRVKYKKPSESLYAVSLTNEKPDLTDENHWTKKFHWRPNFLIGWRNIFCMINKTRWKWKITNYKYILIEYNQDDNTDDNTVADDNTLYSCNKNLEHVFSNLKYDLRNVLDWFKINSMKANPGKFQFMLLGVKNIVHFTINGKIIPCSNEVKLLGITIDNEFKFKKHIEDLCKNASYKLHPLRRIRGYLTVEKARYLLMHLFIASLIMPLWYGCLLGKH